MKTSMDESERNDAVYVRHIYEKGAFVLEFSFTNTSTI